MEIHDPIYGEINISEPVLLELISCKAMQRLKGIDQNAVSVLTKIPWGSFSRYDHSVGVMALIKHLGGNLEEQIAGLLHDVSHTAFSHVVDFVFDAQETQDFHEKNIERIVYSSQIPNILKKYGYLTERVLNHRNFAILEQDIPFLCADRIDYALKTFFSSFGTSVAELKRYLSNLEVVDAKIVFASENIAADFAETFMKGDLQVWGGNYICNTVYHLFSKIAKKAYQEKHITMDDFFTTDTELMGKLKSMYGTELEKLNSVKLIEVGPDEQYDFHVNAKTRYVDPPVKTPSGVQSLSAINSGFREKLDAFLTRRRQGNYVKILS